MTPLPIGGKLPILRADRVALALRVRKVQRVPMEQTGPMALSDHKDRRASKAFRVKPVRPALLVRRDRKATPALMAQTELLAHRVRKGIRVPMARMGLLVRRGHKVQPGLMVRTARTALPDQRVLRARQD